MKRTRLNHCAEFNARIARVALKGLKVVAEIAQDNNLHSEQMLG